MENRSITVQDANVLNSVVPPGEGDRPCTAGQPNHDTDRQATRLVASIRVIG